MFRTDVATNSAPVNSGVAIGGCLHERATSIPKIAVVLPDYQGYLPTYQLA
jgi:hypothetical protein